MKTDRSFPRITLASGILALTIASVCAQARNPNNSGSVEEAIDRGLAFLARDAVAWRAEHGCSSCHHAALVVWSMNEAKLNNYTVDETVLEELTTWLTEAGEGKTSLKRPPEAPEALNTKAVYYSLGLGSVPNRSDIQQGALNLLLRTVKQDQTKNGSWKSWPATRPPLFGGSDETATALATLALLPAVTAGESAAQSAVNKSVSWLKATETDDDPQSVAMRLVLWIQLGLPLEETFPLARRIKARQREDGGWSQTPEGASDAWATGQALYALSISKLPDFEEEMGYGRDFLLKTQREDGSWPMISRPQRSGEAGSEDLIPITGAGTAWAILGLARFKS